MSMPQVRRLADGYARKNESAGTKRGKKKGQLNQMVVLYIKLKQKRGETARIQTYKSTL